MLDHLVLLDELHLPSSVQVRGSLHELGALWWVPLKNLLEEASIALGGATGPGRTFFQSKLEYIVELGFPSRLLMKSMTASFHAGDFEVPVSMFQLSLSF